MKAFHNFSVENLVLIKVTLVISQNVINHCFFPETQTQLHNFGTVIINSNEFWSAGFDII